MHTCTQAHVHTFEWYRVNAFLHKSCLSRAIQQWLRHSGQARHPDAHTPPCSHDALWSRSFILSEVAGDLLRSLLWLLQEECNGSYPKQWQKLTGKWAIRTTGRSVHLKGIWPLRRLPSRDLCDPCYRSSQAYPSCFKLPWAPHHFSMPSQTIWGPRWG